MNYFENTDIDENERRNNAFQALNAVREAVKIAKRNTAQITYENTLDVIGDLDEQLYHAFITLLKEKNESEDVKFYKEKSDALSTEENKVLPEDLIHKDIEEIENAILKTINKKTALKKRKIQLLAALNYFKPRSLSEHKILYRDYFLATRNDLPSPEYQNDSFKDYKIADDRLLRLRLLHPDNEEVVLGADLVYEQFDLERQIVRFVHLQYKVWNTNTLYFTSGSLEEQLDKLDTNICKAGFCKTKEGEQWNGNFRFPHCSAFLRPTSNMQSQDSKLISTGLHMPVCKLQQLKSIERKITKDNSKDFSISHSIFEELFINNLLGSRWLTIDELEQFYEEKELNSYTDRIRIHAQEVLYQTESQKVNKKGL